MITVTYKELDKDGVIHLPFNNGIRDAKEKANILYKQGYISVKVVEIEEKVLYIPGGE